MSISPFDLLEPGTKVKVNNKSGYVVSSKYVPEATGHGLIASNTIHFTHIYKYMGRGTYKPYPIKREYEARVNYSCIDVIIN